MIDLTIFVLTEKVSPSTLKLKFEKYLFHHFLLYSLYYNTYKILGSSMHKKNKKKVKKRKPLLINAKKNNCKIPVIKILN